MSKELAVGDSAPDFSMPTDSGETVTLSAFKGKTLVLYFYPKDDTSGCTSQAIAFSGAVDAFAAKGAVILGVSRDDVASHAKFRAKHNLTIALASDTDGSVTEGYGVWVEKSMYGRKYMGIDRSTFVIGPDGKIAGVWRKVKVPGHAEAVLKTL